VLVAIETITMHPLCLALIRRPDLVVDHLSAYAALLKLEANHAKNALASRALAWLIVFVSIALCVVFAGVALMLGVLQNQFHWILVAVPGAMALSALVAIIWTKLSTVSYAFNTLKAQFLSDATALSLHADRATK
jgi:multidrug efflux pump subunit AcrB